MVVVPRFEGGPLTVHPGALALISCWEEWRGNAPAPRRSDMRLHQLKKYVSFLMVLERNPVRPVFTFRLAGTSLRRLTGRDLTGTDFADLWAPGPSRDGLMDALGRTVSRLDRHVLLVKGVARPGRETALEAVFLPVRVDGRQSVQVLAGLFPLNEPYWLDEHPLTIFGLLDGQSLENPPPGQHERLVSRM